MRRADSCDVRGRCDPEVPTRIVPWSLLVPWLPISILFDVEVTLKPAFVDPMLFDPTVLDGVHHGPQQYYRCRGCWNRVPNLQLPCF